MEDIEHTEFVFAQYLQEYGEKICSKVGKIPILMRKYYVVFILEMISVKVMMRKMEAFRFFDFR